MSKIIIRVTKYSLLWCENNKIFMFNNENSYYYTNKNPWLMYTYIY
jgi:hypothetical protein